MAEDAFTRMEELVGAIPSMEKSAVTLSQHREALQLAKLHDRAMADAHELANVDDEIARVRERLASLPTEDDEARKKCELLVLFWENQRGFKEPPAAHSADAFDKALTASPFNSLADAADAIMSAEDAARVEQEIRDFQKEYAATLRACQKASGSAGSSGL